MTEKKTKQSQLHKFTEAARKLECDDDEKHFDEKLEKIARQKPKPVRDEPDADS